MKVGFVAVVMIGGGFIDCEARFAAFLCCFEGVCGGGREGGCEGDEMGEFCGGW